MEGGGGGPLSSLPLKGRGGFKFYSISTLRNDSSWSRIYREEGETLSLGVMYVDERQAVVGMLFVFFAPTARCTLGVATLPVAFVVAITVREERHFFSFLFSRPTQPVK